MIFSLFSSFNNQGTFMGSRKLMQWIRQPLMEIEKIEERQNLVEIFYEDGDLRAGVMVRE